MTFSIVNSLRVFAERSLIAAACLIGLSEHAAAHSGDAQIHFGTGGTMQLPTTSTIIPDARPVVVDHTNRVIYATSTLGGDFIGALRADGNSDATFGTSGMVPLDEFVTGLAVDSHDRIIVVQRDSSFTTPTSEVSRYLSDGSIDTTFGTGGTTTLRGSTYFYTAQAVVVDTDDSIVIAGNALAAMSADSYPFAARIDSSGVPEGSFGSSGVTVITAGASGISASNTTSLTLDATGNLFIAGYAMTSPTIALAEVAKLTAAGRLDSAFGSTGIVQIDVYGGDSRPHGTDATSLAIDARQNVIVGGVADNWVGFSAAMLTRLLPDGTIDPAFGPGYPELLPIESDPQGQAATVMIDGRDRIVLTGVTQNTDGNTHFFALRFNDDGLPDTTFGIGTGYRLLTDPVWGGRSTFVHGGDILIFGNTADDTAITASEQIGDDLPPLIPPSHF